MKTIITVLALAMLSFPGISQASTQEQKAQCENLSRLIKKVEAIIQQAEKNGDAELADDQKSLLEVMKADYTANCTIEA